MKKLATVLVSLVLTLSLLPAVLSVDVGTGIGIEMETEEFPPLIWLCDHRTVIDDDVEPGRVNGDKVYSAKVETCECIYEQCVTACVAGQASVSFECNGLPCEINFDAQLNVPQLCATYCEEYTLKFSCPIKKGYELIERHNNYAFEGEKLEWIVLVMDKNKIEEVQEVVATLGPSQGAGNDVEVECVELHAWNTPGAQILPSCNARIMEETLKQFDDQTMSYYECTLTVETPESMYAEYYVTVEAIDSKGLSNIMDENEYWFFNPTIALTIDGMLDFGVVRPGTISYSDTILVGNDADIGSGVTLDMFVSGTDFYDPDSSGARCVITNRLKLGNNFVLAGTAARDNVCDIGFQDTDDHLCYYATNGAYSTQNDDRSDAEGYAPIVYGDTFSMDFYNDAELIQANQMGQYWGANFLVPGSEMALTFKLGLPEPCVGDFTDGSIFFWGEAV
ncbi:MAG: hypothetical protein ABIF10_03665 [Candidatus Woesearchaeota archaeon]